MPERFIQASRLIAVDTPLGADRLLLRSFSGTEAVSRLFQFRLDLSSEEANINFDDIIGKNVTIRVKLADNKERYLNGFVSRFAQLPGDPRMAHYEAEVVPWLWFLSHAADCRIFQNMTVPDIVQKIFQDFGFRDFENKLVGSYLPWVYCVQYQETAFHFISRLLEQEGIFYYFRHEKNRHVLVLGDRPTAHAACPNQPRVRFEGAVGAGVRRDDDVVTEWRCGKEFVPGKFATTDYNFETPSSQLLASTQGQREVGGNRRFEIFDYPGEYLKRNDGENIARLRMEEMECFEEIAHGSGGVRDFSPGFRFEIAEIGRRDQNRAYVLTSVTHSAHVGSFASGQAGASHYSNTFSCIPATTPFRPPRRTPKSVVQGPQTAVVTGKSGEEIYTDKYGRVKVQFFWDRQGRKDETTSCWVRVSQPWAGKAWGGIWIPRIGQEVVVDFLEGDPDRPLITGRVYNAEQMPPYDLPGNHTQSGFKSRSSKGGGTGNYNELRFEDKKGSEQILVHAEKDLLTEVENDETRTVGHDRSTTIKNHETLVIQDGNRSEKLEKGNDKLVISMGNSDTELSMGNFTLKCNMGAIEMDAPVNTVTIKAMQVEIQATADLKLSCGASSVELTPAAMILQAPMIKIN